MFPLNKLKTPIYTHVLKDAFKIGAFLAHPTLGPLYTTVEKSTGDEF